MGKIKIAVLACGIASVVMGIFGFYLIFQASREDYYFQGTSKILSGDATPLTQIQLETCAQLGIPTPSCNEEQIALKESLDAGKRLENEDIVMHVHVNLKIIVGGKSVTIPANIGISSELYESHDLDAYGTKNPTISSLHTHDSSGTVHVESTEIRSFTLGEFFDVWGVAFSEKCIMDNCGEGKDMVRMYVNGKEGNDFRQHVLLDGEQIEIVLMKS